MTKLNQSFGIGIIELYANSYHSKLFYPFVFCDLDFKKIDKICKVNKKFEKFIEQTEINDCELKTRIRCKKRLDEICDKYFAIYIEVENYCKDEHISINEE